MNNIAWLSSMALAAALSLAQGGHASKTSDLAPAIHHVKALQSGLLAVKLQSDMDEEVTVALQSQIWGFKDALAELADAAVEGAPIDVDPKHLEAQLAEALGANKPQVQQMFDDKKPPQLDRIYGDELTVKVSRAVRRQGVILIEFRFDIACGFDSVLLAYELRGDQWHRTLRWQSPRYDEIDGAFGDFVEYTVIPQNSPGSWLIAVAHGHPWCTSNMSAFDVDVIQPGGESSPQQAVFHRNFGYRRDYDPVMKPELDGFQLYLEDDSLDPGIVFRPAIYSYRVVAGDIERIQPIANNGRDFVDEWLESPWSDSVRWSAPKNLVELASMHRKIENRLDPKAKDWPSFSYGAVRSCSDSKAHFQVEAAEEWIDDKGASRPDSTDYFQIQQGRNSFAMLSVSSAADSHCNGPDLMPPH